MTMLSDVTKILEEDEYYNGAQVGDISQCTNCGLETAECVSKELSHESLGTYLWKFKCSTCGFEDVEHW